MIGLFDALVEFMVQKNFMRVRTDVFTGRLLMFIESSLDRPVSLSDGAKFMNMTPQALAHSIRRHGLEPFTELAQKRKISEAELRLKRDPQLSIKELSHSLGFTDPTISVVFLRNIPVCPPLISEIEVKINVHMPFYMVSLIQGDNHGASEFKYYFNHLQ
jgi:AraC-like DNA-binding protein